MSVRSVKASEVQVPPWVPAENVILLDVVGSLRVGDRSWALSLDEARALRDSLTEALAPFSALESASLKSEPSRVYVRDPFSDGEDKR